MSTCLSGYFLPNYFIHRLKSLCSLAVSDPSKLGEDELFGKASKKPKTMTAEIVINLR